MPAHPPPQPKDRLIVALDVPTHSAAVDLVRNLSNVSFFKIGLQLFLAGDLFGLLHRLQDARGDADQGSIFIDLKIAGDISNTINGFVEHAQELGIRFITFAEAAETSITRHTLAAGREARGNTAIPQLLMVPLLSSLAAPQDPAQNTDTYIVERGGKMLELGCDGLVVSGTAIAACRRAYTEAVLVSPGIRLDGAASDDHKRFCTPGQAIQFGADYLVVGRPVLHARDPRGAAQRIIDEIGEASVAGAV